MDKLGQTQLQTNMRRFQQSLERIFEKYSKLQYQDGGIEVDLDSTHSETLGHYMKLSKKKLNKLKSQSLADLRDESLRSQDITGDSQLDLTHYESGALDNPDSSCQAEDEVTNNYDAACLTVSSCNESQTTFNETNNQEQEDQDEQLETSLQSQGSSLGDLYPNMISQIEQAWRRQHVSEAADSVLQRYRRWRRQANKTNHTIPFNSTLRHTTSKKKSSRMQIKDAFKSTVGFLAEPSTLTNSVSRSPVKTVTYVHPWKTQQQCSPVTARAPQKREVQPTVVVMDFSSVSQPDEVELNKTFIVSEQASPQRFHLREHPSNYIVSPSRHWYPTAKMSQDHSFRIKESSPHHVQGPSCSVPASEHTTLLERPDIYGSIVRRSPYKAQLTSKEKASGSSCVFVASPKVQSYSRGHKRPRSDSTSLSSPLPKIRVPQRTLEYADSRPSFQQQQSSPQSATAGRPHGLRRQLSFDSSLQSIKASYTAKDLDDDINKLYHKFVCQNKSFLNGPPCRVCAKSSDASRGQSFSNLAALALSPHRSVLRKRHRELVWDSYPQSKRFRDSCSSYSPGSKRYRSDLLGDAVPPHQLDPQKSSCSYRNYGLVRKLSPHMWS